MWNVSLSGEVEPLISLSSPETSLAESSNTKLSISFQIKYYITKLFAGHTFPGSGKKLVKLINF